MPKIVTVTLNPTIDTSCAVDHVIVDKKLRCSQPRFEPGGGGLNVARAIRLLGGESTAFWTCGGPLGLFLATLLDQEGVTHRPIPISGMTRENLIVYENASQDQYRFCMPGPQIQQEEMQACLQSVRDLAPPPDYLVLSGSLPTGVDEDIYAQFARQVPAWCRVVLDTSGRALTRGLEASVYLIKPNISELGAIAGREIVSDLEILDVSRKIVRENKAQVVVTSLGTGGGVLVTKDQYEVIRAPTVPIRSKVGAGDSMVAGLVLSLSRGRTVPESVRYGIAAGSAKVMNEGTQLCRLVDTERLAREMAQRSDSTVAKQAHDA